VLAESLNSGFLYYECASIKYYKKRKFIYALNKGEIVESGTYEELIYQDSLFTQLAKRQIS
jgi:ABC-type multidrug transport system fused ATPase/permease subunit